ncbi:MAG TPA: hypothetical protein DCP28_26045, partial [Cytophagales bacterium]|nr:hypothetical protein [Cytophagales bacterium]
LTNRSVYVLVLDARKDAQVAEQVRTWLRKIEAQGGKSPVLVVANQIDVNPGFGFENATQLQQEFPQIKAFLKLSCQEGGAPIAEFKSLLEEWIPQAELFGSQIDERWFPIKETLEQETGVKHFVDEARFRAICAEHGLPDKAQQQQAIRFLHDLGIVLHFEALNLKSYYVLDPYWITYGVYQLVTSKRAGEQHGEVLMDQIEFIVNEEEEKSEGYQAADFKRITYSFPQCCFLVDILQEFKLCFYAPGKESFVLPDLLDTSEPTALTQPLEQTERALRFVYQYDYLPKSLMPFFMVETHHTLIARWRTGCVLEGNG